VNGTTEGDVIWQPEGVVRRFKTALYIYIYIELKNIIIIIIYLSWSWDTWWTRSGLTYPEVSWKVYHDSFCHLGSSVN